MIIYNFKNMCGNDLLTITGKIFFEKELKALLQRIVCRGYVAGKLGAMIRGFAGNTKSLTKTQPLPLYI